MIKNFKLFKQTIQEQIKATEKCLYKISMNSDNYDINDRIGYLIKNKVKVNYKGR